MKLKNIFLTISVASFTIALFATSESIFWYMGLPMGAIFFCLFMIFMLLEKETALFDEQSRAAMCTIEKSLNNKTEERNTSDKGNRSPGFTTAPSH